MVPASQQIGTVPKIHSQILEPPTAFPHSPGGVNPEVVAQRSLRHMELGKGSGDVEASLGPGVVCLLRKPGQFLNTYTPG